MKHDYNALFNNCPYCDAEFSYRETERDTLNTTTRYYCGLTLFYYYEINEVHELTKCITEEDEPQSEGEAEYLHQKDQRNTPRW